MSEPVFVPGRPAWSVGESIEVQRLIVEHNLTATQFRALEEFAANPAEARFVAHSTARALRSRGLGEITAKQLSHTLTRGHPKACFLLGDIGRAIAQAIADASITIERVNTNLTRVTINRPGVHGFGPK